MMGSPVADVTWLLSASLKAALLLLASWLGAVLLRRGTAAARHQMWALGVSGALILPVLCWALPLLSMSLSLSPDSPSTGAGRALPEIVVFATGRPAASAAPEWPTWLAITWAAGALLVSLRFLRAHAAARRLARGAEPARAGSWLSAQREAAASLAMRGDTFLGRTEAITSPMTIGVWRPRVLLPATADAWSPERLRAVLIHELGHVRRRDTLIQLVAQLVAVLYWWNPLAWLAAARLRIEREHACDDLVLGAGIRPSSYAADLLAVARGRSRDEAAHASAISMIDGSGTERRLRRILESPPPRRPPGARFRLAARGAAIAFAVALASTSSPRDLRAPRHAAAQEDGGPVWLGRPFVSSSVPPVLVAEGNLDASAVAKEMEGHVGTLERCYEQRSLVRPDMTGGVVLRWTILAGGVFEISVLRDTIHDAEILSCVESVVRNAHFPASPDGLVEVSFSFFFGAPPPPDDGC